MSWMKWSELPCLGVQEAGLLPPFPYLKVPQGTLSEGLGYALMVRMQVTAEQVKYLVSDLEARFDLQDEDGWTCAHWAAQHGRVSALQGVMDTIVGLASEPEAGAAAAAELRSVRDKKGKTAADIARDADHPEATLRDLLDILEGVEEESVGDSNVLALD